MDRDEIVNFLRENLRVDIDYRSSQAYYLDSYFSVRLLLGGEEISECKVSVPDWEEKRGEY